MTPEAMSSPPAAVVAEGPANVAAHSAAPEGHRAGAREDLSLSTPNG
jgi:hypothetical protein